MDRVKYGVLSVVALVTLLWIQAEPSLLTSDNFFQWRSGLIQYSGILSLILMSIAMVLALRYCALSQTLDLTLEAEAKWPSHQAGQFAYLCFAGEEPRPFTIASAPNGSQLRFLIKELGDFTTGLHQRLSQGDVLQIEGPYGKFSFTAEQPQIWIGAGVGIAPFSSALKKALKPYRVNVDKVFHAEKFVMR